jgi:hypothetical protein
MKVNEPIKETVLRQIAGEKSYAFESGVTWKVGDSKVHVRYATGRGGRFRFNLNPSTMRADYEVWICGKPERYYLIPHSVVREMHEHHRRYQDRQHPELTVVSVDVNNHRAQYARGGIKRGLRDCFLGHFRN